MTAPNRNTLWGRTVVEELVRNGVEAVCIAPGSRSTPLTVACYEHPDLRVFSHLDERSAAYFALGRARRTGQPTPLVCTSGTAAANFHPAVIEASQARVPMLLLTADRPPELRDSGANQTIDQEKLYGGSVRWYRDLPEPEATGRKLRRLRTDVSRALGSATGTPAGPVHLNCPFRKPLEPVEVPGDVPEGFERDEPLAARGRESVTGPTADGSNDGDRPPYVTRTAGAPTLTEDRLDALADALADADRGLVVAGPADPPVGDGSAVARLSRATGFPVLADPLSAARFGDHVTETPVLGGYDGYVGGPVTDGWPDPDVVVRVGASPTSKPLRKWLRDRDARQFLVDPAGEWREAEYTASDLVVADPDRTLRALADRLTDRVDPDADPTATYRERWLSVERAYWERVAAARERETFEGGVVATAVADAPDPATLFVSNSMPVREADRFGRPRAADLTVLGNRGASGIDGITSTALGAGSGTDDPLVLVTGDLAYYHDTNGLLAVARCDVDATIVLINNDGGGIFHLLPIEEFDPPFTEGFRTPHGLDFEPTADLHGLAFSRVPPGKFAETYRESLVREGTQVVEVPFDADASHETRERIHDRIRSDLVELS